MFRASKLSPLQQLGRMSQPTKMSSQTSSRSGSAAPWRDLFQAHLAAMKQPSFTLATVSPPATSSTTPPSTPSTTTSSSSSAGRGDGTSRPHARTCNCRGLWTALPSNPRNPAVFDSDLPVFTTDARMAKVAQLGRSGGVVEAVWWASERMAQWRVRGRAHVLGGGGEEEEDEARRMIRLRMRGSVGDDGAERKAGEEDDGGKVGAETKEWSWDVEITAHFGNLSPLMRGSFRNPAPGLPRAVPPRDGEGPGQTVDDLHDRLARANFRVCVIVPDEVELVDLSRADDPRRWLYTYVGPSPSPSASSPSRHEGGEVLGEWERCELWP